VELLRRNPGNIKVSEEDSMQEKEDCKRWPLRDLRVSDQSPSGFNLLID